MDDPADFVDAEVIKAKLDEVLEAVERIEGRLGGDCRRPRCDERSNCEGKNP